MQIKNKNVFFSCIEQNKRYNEMLLYTVELDGDQELL